MTLRNLCWPAATVATRDGYGITVNAKIQRDSCTSTLYMSKYVWQVVMMSGNKRSDFCRNISISSDHTRAGFSLWALPSFKSQSLTLKYLYLSLAHLYFYRTFGVSLLPRKANWIAWVYETCCADKRALPVADSSQGHSWILSNLRLWVQETVKRSTLWIFFHVLTFFKKLI